MARVYMWFEETKGLPVLKSTRGHKEGKKMAVSRSRRAGLQLPVGRIHRLLKTGVAANGGRVGATAAVYATAIVEYLSSEVLEKAGNVCEDLELKKIKSQHLRLGSIGNEELDTLIKAAIAGPGVLPHIYTSRRSKISKN